MSTFTRTTTPAFSANPLQTFVTYKQARRAAKAGGTVAIVYGGLAVLALFGSLLASDFIRPSQGPLFEIEATMILAAPLFLLGWRTWVRPGPWKASAVLALVLLDVVASLFRFSVPGLIIAGVMLNFSIIAFRGALAMKRLHTQVDLHVF